MGDAKGKKSITAENIILCEGKDDESILKHLTDKIADNLTKTQFQVMSYDGKDKLEKHMQEFHFMTGFKSVKSIVILRDSDQDMENAEKSITEALRRAGYAVPSKLCEIAIPKGYEKHPRTAYVLMPGITTVVSGCLEDLCLDILRNPNDVRMSIAQNAINEIEQSKELKLKNPSKNKLYTYFSLTDNLYGCKIAEAVGRKAFDFESLKLEPLRKLLIEILETE